MQKLRKLSIVLDLSSSCKAGVSNIRPRGQNRPGKDSNPAHWSVLENVKGGHKVGKFNLILRRFAAPPYFILIKVIK